MEMLFICKNPGRRQAVRDSSALNGIDYLEVSLDQKRLDVFFLKNLPGQTNGVPSAPALKESNIRIEGGVRIRDIQVTQLKAKDNVLSVSVTAPGDYSTYALRLVGSATDPLAPTGFDTALSSIEFSFKAQCPSDFDCKSTLSCTPDPVADVEIDYLAKDYSTFRRLMLDRMSVVMPDWRERNPADLQIALTEALAYTADHLSYFQDAVAAEAYLGTARRRVSVRRHARLLDYLMHDGCNSRVWIVFDVESGKPADGTKIPFGSAVSSEGDNPEFFELLQDITLSADRSRISFYTWSDSQCCLPRGATKATMLHTGPFLLKKGDLLLFEEVLSPTTGLPADADPAHRHVVRLKNQPRVFNDRLDNTPVVEIEWFESDALPFPLCLTSLVTTQGAPKVVEASVARANVALADHGLTLKDQDLEATAQGARYPRLKHTGITFRLPVPDKDMKASPAVDSVKQDPHAALAAVELHDGAYSWSVVRDLLSSDRFATNFVVETERDGTAWLRFGDGILGKEPTTGASFKATYRIGNGRAGNVGAEALTKLLGAPDGITKVWNPLPAVGGTEPESMEDARLFAPQAFRVQERAVTEADYAEVTERHSEVQKAAATFRWTGSWFTVFLTIDRKRGLPVDADDAFKQRIRGHLEKYRLAGYDLEVCGPIFVALDIQLHVCVKPRYFRSDVHAALLAAFTTFFDPDNFTFGQPVFLSAIYQTAMEVAGVASVEIVKFQRWGKEPDQEIDNGVLKTAPLEVIRLDNDPNFKENGKIEFVMDGGL